MDAEVNRDSALADRPARNAILPIRGSLSLLLGAILSVALLLRLIHLSRKVSGMTNGIALASPD